MRIKSLITKSGLKLTTKLAVTKRNIVNLAISQELVDLDS